MHCAIVAEKWGKSMFSMRKLHGCRLGTGRGWKVKSRNTTPFYPLRIPDSKITAMRSCIRHQVAAAVVEPKLEWSGNGRRSSVESMRKWGKVLVVRFKCHSFHRYVPVVHSECRWLRDGRCPWWRSGSLVCHSIPGWEKDNCWVWNQGWIPP